MNELINIKNQLKAINYIYYALTSGLILFFIITIYLMENVSYIRSDGLDKYLNFIIPLFGLLMMFLSRYIYNKMVIGLGADADVLRNVVQYRNAKIISWAFIEGASFLALVAAILTLNYLYIAIFIFLFGYFLLSRSSKESFIKDLRLTSEQSDKIFKS